MSNQDFRPVLVKDSRINDITDRLDYAVHSGSASNTYQRFPAVSSSANSLSFNVQIPSESIVVSRDILLEAEVKFQIEITNVPTDEEAFAYGATDSFQAFPLNSLFTTVSATINNTNVSINLQDILPQLLRMVDQRDLQRYNGMTPCYPDKNYKYFTDAERATNSPLKGILESGYDNELLPRGCHPLIEYTVARTVVGQAGTTANLTSTGVTNTFVIDITAKFTEPLFLSPFIFGGCSHYNNQGFVGLNTLNLVMNVDSTLKRFMSTSKNYNYTLRLDSQRPFNAALLMNFLSTQPTDLIKARNIVPFHDYPRFVTGTSNTSPINPNTRSEIVCQNIQLNQIPDMFLICVRKPMSQQTIKDSSTFYPIEKISVNLNNASGLLSSASTQDLYRISRANGCNQSWLEFFGNAATSNVATDSNVPDTLATSGSLLVLNPSRDLSLPAYLSNGSIGQFSFQINLTVRNNGGEVVTPEVVIVAVNSGLFSTIAGSSAIYTGILTKQMVLDVQQSGDAAIPSAQYERMVGGSLANRVASAVKQIAAPFRKMGKVSDSSCADGGAMSAGAMCGGMRGAMSGGRRLDALAL